ncbi:hypothetical protein [Streptomyces sp. SD15]
MLARRSDYERRFRELIERGTAEGAFRVQSARIASYSILDMGIGVASWFREGGEFTVGQLAYQYGDMALRIVGARFPGTTAYEDGGIDTPVKRRGPAPQGGARSGSH